MMKTKQIKIAELAASMILAGGACAIAQPSQPVAESSLDGVAAYFGTTAADLTTNPTSILNQFLYGDTNKLNAVYAFAKPLGLYSNDLATARSSFAYAAGNNMSPDQFMMLIALPGSRQFRMGDPILNVELLKYFRHTPRSWVGSPIGIDLANLTPGKNQILGQRLFWIAGQAVLTFINTLYAPGGLIVSASPPVAIPGYSVTAGTNYVSPIELSDKSKTALINAFASITEAIDDLSADRDQDGMSNYQEILAGTDPFNPQSRLKLSVAQANPMVLTFTGVTNEHYSVLYTDIPSSTNWLTLTIVQPITNGVIAVVDIDRTSNRFYRVHLEYQR